ncbi:MULTISPECIES: hypothetical protein [Acidiphilium]|jgi:hypothetical protein|uniref:hypothetical protein n=1 Tax=Acidiphilium TaxID=522 RepID=UPI00030B9BB4|nr:MULTISPECIES: hypothetical protein [Acidiphilium]MBU6357049.1 hypothetical protein [Rhodospirillales bacterium]KDM65608.1 hypothetical protein ACIDI_96c00220 [Acidiphilium sp. JA12-A1]MBS3023981.1 hypothetical protein [Acidiphilium multivorum]MDE2329122.1 hypothetical protein [Rhodospirillales bacterium]UNC14969.1 hypothetical protein FE249_12530 [Acidiphilium multivorum]
MTKTIKIMAALAGFTVMTAGTAMAGQIPLQSQPIATEAAHSNSAVTFGNSATVGSPAGTQTPVTTSPGFTPFLGN